MATTLKLKCQGSVHRVPLKEEQVNYESIAEVVQGFHPGEVTAKYLDDEGDMCTLCAATFSDFLSLSGAAGGKRILRLELFPLATAPAAAEKTEQAEPELATVGGISNPFAGIFHLLKGGKCKGKGKGKWKGKWFGKGKCGGDAGADENEATEHGFEEAVAFDFEELFRHLGGHLILLKMLKMSDGMQNLAIALRQLWASGMLNAKCVAAVVANSLGDLISLTVDFAAKIDWAAKINSEVSRQILEVLLKHTADKEGLEECAGKIEAALTGENTAVPVSEMLLELLTTLSALPFGARVSFFEGLYTSQQERIDGLLDKARPFLAMLPPVPVEHCSIICDGCDREPLQGPRFKCKGLDDYDLCARCLAEKDTAFGGKCAGHDFEMITISHPMFAKGWEHGKGMCKGKGKWKGKGKGVTQPEDGEQSSGRRCANEKCGYMATWHVSHCCEACRWTGGQHHGKMCERVASLDPPVVGSVAKAPEPAPAAPGGAAAAPAGQHSGEAAPVAPADPPTGEAAPDAPLDAGSVRTTPSAAETTQHQAPVDAGKLKGKGKGKCAKGQVKCRESAAPCANKDCGLMATWHATHCCEGCKRTNGKTHGGRCERVRAAEAPEAPSTAAAAGAARGPPFDLCFPVALGDGQRMTIGWNFGDDPQQVAEAFAAQHCIPLEELPTIRHFVEQCTAAGAQQAK